MSQTVRAVSTGDYVEFYVGDGFVASGYVAERDISPITMMARVRVVDRLCDVHEDGIGEWVNVVDLRRVS